MNPRRSRTTSALAGVIEVLEGRTLLSGGVGGIKTTLDVSNSSLDQPITIAVTVRGPAAAGAPQGTVNILDHGKLLGSLTLAPTTSNAGRYAVSSASQILTPVPGGTSYYVGKHTLTAVYVPSGTHMKSSATKSFAVTKPAYTPIGNGVEISTVTQGSGAAIQTGQTAGVLYTGYLQKTGAVFDDSIADGGTPLSVPLGAGQVIPGFDAGIVGMQVGETRIIKIPPNEGYGNTANGPIPADSTLIFVVTLESISSSSS
jgi:FKBP-type peptidyl-prolyl cis-trans isomerase/Bacterial Ig-like domain (group 3)